MKKFLRNTLLVVLALIIAFLVYAVPYYHAQDLPEISDPSVTVQKEGYSTFYDGPGTSSALIFYPGAKVDDSAYSWMMFRLAEEGIDCYLVHMPLHLAILGENRAEKIIEHGEYEHWILAGHSLGGAMAAQFSAEHADVDGLVLLAAYSTKKLPESVQVLSIYGSEDGVLNRENYEKYRDNLPDDFTENIITGGNHGNFGYYGDQKGDQPASISREEQQEMTVQEILHAFSLNND